MVCSNCGIARGRPLRPVVVALLLLTAVVISSAPLSPPAHAQAVVATVSVGSAPDAAAYDSSKGEVFVANGGDDTVSVVSDATNHVVTTVNV